MPTTPNTRGALRCATASCRRRAVAFFDDMLDNLRAFCAPPRILGVHVQLREKDWRPPRSRLRSIRRCSSSQFARLAGTFGSRSQPPR